MVRVGAPELADTTAADALIDDSQAFYIGGRQAMFLSTNE